MNDFKCFTPLILHLKIIWSAPQARQNNLFFMQKYLLYHLLITRDSKFLPHFYITYQIILHSLYQVTYLLFDKNHIE